MAIAASPRTLTRRLAGIDAYRGFVMLLMASHGLGLASAARVAPENGWLQFLSFHVSHIPWRGWSLWDLIQPSFMFLVGTSMAFSYAARAARGQSYIEMLRHAVLRALILILLGVFLRSNGRDLTYWTFEDVLTQIGLGYVFLFLLWGRGWFIQLVAATAILAGYWALFYYYPLPPVDFDYASVGVSQEFRLAESFTGYEAHWNKNTNPAHAFDVWFLNLFPRESEFLYNGGGYHTLSFIPSLATMIFGLMAGGLLRGAYDKWTKLFGLLIFAGVLIAAGNIWDQSGYGPLVKRIWTPSWAIWSAGVSTLLLAVFFFFCDVCNMSKLAFPLRVVGMNSIVIYVMSYPRRRLDHADDSNSLRRSCLSKSRPAADAGPAAGRRRRSVRNRECRRTRRRPRRDVADSVLAVSAENLCADLKTNSTSEIAEHSNHSSVSSDPACNRYVSNSPATPLTCSGGLGG